jgi:predicted nucleic acid-binding protein
VILYLETSSLVKLYVREPDSDTVRELIGEADVVATSLLAYAEARAAFARKRREKGISEIAYKSVKEALERDWPSYFILSLAGQTVKTAGDLAEKHALRGFDALHLASALDLRLSGASPIRFLTADTRLHDAARAEGFETS